VQSRQREVERHLVWLIEALAEERERREQEQQQQQQQKQQQEQSSEGEERLVPDSAELKLLRRMELEVQGQIERLIELHPELRTGDADPLVLEDIVRLAGRHERLTTLFEGFRARLGLPAPDAVQDGAQDGAQDAGQNGLEEGR